MSIRWFNKRYGVMDLRGPKAPSDPYAKEGQSMLSSQLDPGRQALAIEQQTLRTTGHLTEDAIRKALQDAQERLTQIRADVDKLSLDLEAGATGIQTDASSIQGVPVVTTPPTNGQILTYDGGATGGTGWRPLSLVAGEGIDIIVSGVSGANTIAAELASTTNAGVVELATSAETAAGLAVQASDTRLSDARTPTGTAGGDLAGTYPNPAVDGIHSRPIDSTAPSTDALYRWDGDSWAVWEPKWMIASLSADQTANLGAGNRIEFDSIVADSGHVTLDILSNVGEFTLPMGKWLIIVSLSVVYSANTGSLAVRVRNNTAGTFSGLTGFARPYTRTVDDWGPAEARTILVNTSPVTMEARINVSSSVTAIDTATGITIVALA